MVKSTDVVVIGAGVQGASLAFHLARRGASVTIIERTAVGAGATGRSSGLVRMHYDVEADTRLAWASLPWFVEWAERVGGDCGFTRTGLMQLVPPAHRDDLRANVAAYQRLGIPTEVIGAREIARLAPSMKIDDEDIAAYEPESGYADPASTASGFLAAARRLGARFLGGREVTAIAVEGGRVRGVSTRQESIAADVVVDAAGAWAARVARLVGLDIPVTTWRHDTAFVRAPEAVRLPFPVVIDAACDMYFRPEGSRLVLVGLEDQNKIGGSPDRETSQAEPDFAERVAARIVQRMPAMSEATLHSAHSGQDGITPDQHAILGAAGPDGFYLDCGHSGPGFKTAPAVGLCLSELILDGRSTTVDITPFGLARFAEGRPLVGEHAYEAIWH